MVILKLTFMQYLLLRTFLRFVALFPLKHGIHDIDQDLLCDLGGLLHHGQDGERRGDVRRHALRDRTVRDHRRLADLRGLALKSLRIGNVLLGLGDVLLVLGDVLLDLGDVLLGLGQRRVVVLGGERQEEFTQATTFDRASGGRPGA